ncbi:hypothetical protein P8605_08680, partial [Streptomyces sp. T-3]|nr:hypothetical protein [Streptomyces sp. T-3]
NLTSANDRANEADSKAMTVPADTTSNSVSTTPAPDDSSAPPNTEAPGTTADGAPAGPGTLAAAPAPGPTPEAGQATPPDDAPDNNENSATPADDDGSGSPDTSVRRTPPPMVVSGEKKRLAPGALRQMVIDHLTAHPTEAFTATGISRRIEKSSGAIANVLVKITEAGITEQVTERPRAYRLAAPASQ